MSNQTFVVKCPNCKVLVERKNDDFPFCSERCKMIDLGNWASDSYKIKGEPVNEFDDITMDHSSIH